jgi:DNA polymerase III delta subunit
MLQAALARSDLAGSLAIVRALFAGGDRLAPWLGALYTHFKKLSDVLELPRGLSEADAARQLRTKPFIYGKLRDGAAHFGEQGVACALGAIFETDWAAKTSRVPTRLAFELLVYRLCRPSILIGSPWFGLDSVSAYE